MVAVPDPDSSAAPVIDAEHVSFAYGAEPVLDDVTFRVDKGEFAALVGPNGVGEVDAAADPARPARARGGHGRGVRRHAARARATAGGSGTCRSGRSSPPDLPATVEEVVRGGGWPGAGGGGGPAPRDRDAVDHALESVALTDLRARDASRELSGGQQQRVLIAKALVGDPELLVLDEPIAGVDAESQRLFRDSLVHLVDRARRRGAAGVARARRGRRRPRPRDRAEAHACCSTARRRPRRPPA